ncbi:MAG: hypothetical protein ABI806_22245 [Candidatus Solibacter sp.]
MDAAHKFARTAILSATALLLATAGMAQTPILQAPATVGLFGSGGQEVNVTSSIPGTPIVFAIGAPVYGNTADGDWLSVQGGTTTPAVLAFSLKRQPNTPGAITATVTLTPSVASGASAVTITVTYNGGQGGGGTSVLSANPNPLNFNLPVSTTSAVTPVSISTTGSVNQTIQSATANVNWLNVQVNNASVVPGAPGSLSVTASSDGLANTTYSGAITVTPTSGPALTISVNLTVGGGSGNNNWSVSPSTSVNLSYTTGGAFPSQLFTLTPPNGAATYNVNSLISQGGWLLVSDGTIDGANYPNVPVSAGFYLKAGSQVAALAQGSYQGQAFLTDSNGANPLTITINLSVNGGNSSGLVISPNPLTFNANVGGASQSAVVTMSSSTTSGNVLISGSLPSWLSYGNLSATNVGIGQQVTFPVFANPAGLSANTYAGDISVSIGGQSGVLNVKLVVGGGSNGGGGNGTSAVAPTSLQFTYQTGTPNAFVAQQKLVITGPAGSWSTTVSSGSPWLKISPTSGSSLPNPESSGDAPVVFVDPTGLAIGSYSGQITVNAPGGSTNIQVSLNVVGSTILLPTPGSLIFSAQTGQAKPAGQSVFVSYSDNGLNFNTAPVTAVANDAWITLTGQTTAGVTVNVDQSGKATGVYTGSITFNNAVGGALVSVPVVLVVNGGGSNGGGGSGVLTFSQNSFAFTSVNGAVTPLNSNLTVSAPSATSFVGTISYLPNNAGNWLTVTPLSSITTSTLSLSANAGGLANGTYNATISFNVNGSIQTVGVTLTVTSSSGGNTGNVNVSPTSLTFSAQQGTNPATQTVSVNSQSGAAGIPFTVQVSTNGGANWLSTSAGSSNSAPSTLTVTVNSAGLQAGTYSGNIQIQPNGGATVNVPVTLTVTTPPAVSATPTSLSFDYRLGDSAPAAKTLTVSGGGGGTLTFSATPSSNGNWLVVSPALGTTPGTVNVSVNPSSFTSTGVFNGTVTVAGAGGAPGSTTVSVVVNVTAPLPTLTRVTNAASYATGTIAPGEIITLFAADPAHPIGPATAVGLTLDSTGKVATKIGNVEVLINGFASPMIYASATQVAAVVPYELKQFVSANVVVKFLGQTSNGVSLNVVTTQPGIFTANASGTGPGAILNSNSTTNSPSNPATRGDTIVVYLTGEGETSPAGVTGKVTTVAAPPNPLTPGPLLPVSVTIAGQGANWSFAGEAPGFVSGVMQLNVIVPTGVPAGDQPIMVTIGGNQSQSGVTVSLK